MRKILTTSLHPLLRVSRHSFSQLAKFQTNFLTTTNLPFIQHLYSKWLVDRKSVDKSFGDYFELLQFTDGSSSPIISSSSSTETQTASSKQIAKQLKMRMMIDAYRNLGHQFAKIDPLDLPVDKNRKGRLPDNALDITKFGFSAQDRTDSIIVKSVREEGGKDNGPYTIQQFEDYLKSIYCDKIGLEYMHLLNKQERDFLKKELEEKVDSLEKMQLTKEEQLATLRRLTKDQVFLDFLMNKFATFKRFTLEGLNAATSSIGQLVESAVEAGVQNIQFGMAHRGRLNTLYCVFDKPAQAIFREFFQKSTTATTDDNKFGDVKYHLGYTARKKINGREVVLSILPNPSHLEAVNPLVAGSTRAIQQDLGDYSKALGVVIHGDAALSGQGIVYQSLGFQDLVDYTTGGNIHIVLNNQIGFTTNPNQSRSSFYCTQVAKVVDSPVIHVNADQPDILDKCMKIAVAYRQKFRKDIFIDIVGYRRFGHNEQDQPFFTQPVMYNKIKDKQNVFQLYSKKLLAKGVIDQEGINKIKLQFQAILEKDYQKVISDTKYTPQIDYLQINKIRTPTLWGSTTGVPKTVLSDLFKKITTWPTQFNLHPVIKKIYQERINNFTNNQNLDWATMQSLAWASILHQGYGVRVSGQDVQRGTFSHRHALISDQNRDVQKYVFLKNVSDKVRITNSHLSEYGVSGFQYGYSITNPNSLVIWQAQFGDFANGAAILIDNFLAAGQTKWGQQSGLVFSLPHGMDGQGPQHSQGRIQRFLQLCDDKCDEDQSMTFQQQLRTNNLAIIYCSTTSNYFHALRRQVHRDYRKPLIALNSKKLLKFKGANRPIEDILQGTSFVPVYGDTTVNASKVKKVLICSGQVYYDLINRRQQLKRQDIAIVRIEQLAPFPHQALKKALSVYGPSVSYHWVQEEHQNYGPWNWIYPRLRLLLKQRIGFYGRPSSASTAVGALKLHKQEEAVLLRKIFEE